MVRIIDDAELLRLAAEPPCDAAPVLRRANWFTPLVALLAVAPVLIAAAYATFDEETAGWGLRALAVHQARLFTEWLSPGSNWPETPLTWAPPLQAWLAAPLLRLWPAGTWTPLLAVSCVSIMAATAVSYLFAEEACSAHCAVLAAACFGLHPQTLRLAQTGGPDALCLFLMTVTAWGLWGHCNAVTEGVTFRLMMAGIAWGLLLLSGGPIAIAFLAVVSVWLIWSTHCGNTTVYPRGPSSLSRFRSAAFDLAVLVATGGALASWWLAMMLSEHGLPFLSAWIIGQAGPEPFAWGAMAPRRSWTLWLESGAFLGGWWLVGLISAWKLGWSARQSPESHVARWLIVWTVFAAAIRAALLWLRVEDVTVIRLWETFALWPAVMLAAQGLDSVLRREASWQLVLLGLMLTIGQVCWLATGHVSIGVIVGGTFGTLVLASAPLALGLRRTSLAWTEAEIRRWVAAFTVITLCGHTALNWNPSRPNTERAVWERVFHRLRDVEEVTQVSLVISQRSDAPQLRYLTRSLWPTAVKSQSTGLDQKLIDTMRREQEAPHSRMVVVEWSRNQLPSYQDGGSGWQLTQIVEPEPYRGRRLAVHLWSPATR